MFTKIFALFLTWRIALFVIALIATLVIPQFKNSFPYADQVLKITHLPSFVWGFGNFDGVHYLRIAQNGYDAQYSQAFFPLYPLLIRFVNIIPRDSSLDTRIFVDPSYFFTGFIISNIFFLLALILFYKLVRIDFTSKIAFGSLILLMAFPSSFYFGAIYTESLFFFLTVGAIYFARKGNFLLSGIFTALASATRIFGLLLIPFLLIEFLIKFRKEDLNLKSWQLTKGIIGILIAPFGALLYMLYLKINFDNPLYFLTSQPLFGAERTSGSLILLPQVIYRYLKIFVTVPANSQLFFNASLEFSFTIVILVSLFLLIKKMRTSYFVFTLGCLILPTLTGTFSSMPRYSLMGFLVLPLVTQFAGKYYIILLGTLILINIILIGLFIRGYWVA